MVALKKVREKTSTWRRDRGENTLSRVAEPPHEAQGVHFEGEKE